MTANLYDLFKLDSNTGLPPRQAPRLTVEQANAAGAIYHFLTKTRDPTYTVFGLAGTGKTTVLAEVAANLPQSILCCFTAKACSILRVKTGRPAYTIHSLIYRLWKIDHDDRGREVMHWTESENAHEIRGSILLLDEVSMCPDFMVNDLLRHGVRIVAFGDPGQLPPVKGRPYFITPNVTLQTIHRQALESPIIRQAHRVRQGLSYESDGPNFQVVEKFGDAWRLADAVIVWKIEQWIEVTKTIRRLRGYARMTPQAGEPIYCKKNNYYHEVWNGVKYPLLRPFPLDCKTITIDVEGERKSISPVEFMGMPSALLPHDKLATKFTFGYATTCHQAQGSEYPFVCIVDGDWPSDKTKLLYTAITRASERVLIVRRS